MSNLNKFLSRKDKYSYGTHRNKVMSSPVSTPSPIQTPSSTRSRTSSYSSFSSLSLAFSTPVTKRSPRLQAHDGQIECCTADSNGFILQPKRYSGTLNGFFEGGEFKTPQKEEEKKVRYLHERAGLEMRLIGTDQSSLTTAFEKWDHDLQGRRHCVCPDRRLCPRGFRQSLRTAYATRRIGERHHKELRP